MLLDPLQDEPRQLHGLVCAGEGESGRNQRVLRHHSGAVPTREVFERLGDGVVEVADSGRRADADGSALEGADIDHVLQGEFSALPDVSCAFVPTDDAHGIDRWLAHHLRDLRGCQRHEDEATTLLAQAVEWHAAGRTSGNAA